MYRLSPQTVKSLLLQLSYARNFIPIDKTQVYSVFKVDNKLLHHILKSLHLFLKFTSSF